MRFGVLNRWDRVAVFTWYEAFQQSMGEFPVYHCGVRIKVYYINYELLVFSLV